MFSISTGILGQLAKALLNGESNLVEELIEKKIADLGKDLISEVVNSSPLGLALSVTKQLKSGLGANEYNRMREAWLNSLLPTPPTNAGLLGRVTGILQNELNGATQDKSSGKWTWSKSRNEWLDESWKHNWRSQPRDSRGRWIPGRLKTVYISAGVRKARNKRRRLIRKGVREIIRGN